MDPRRFLILERRLPHDPDIGETPWLARRGWAACSPDDLYIVLRSVVPCKTRRAATWNSPSQVMLMACQYGFISVLCPKLEALTAARKLPFHIIMASWGSVRSQVDRRAPALSTLCLL